MKKLEFLVVFTLANLVGYMCWNPVRYSGVMSRLPSIAKYWAPAVAKIGQNQMCAAKLHNVISSKNLTKISTQKFNINFDAKCWPKFWSKICGARCVQSNCTMSHYHNNFRPKLNPKVDYKNPTNIWTKPTSLQK